MSDFFVEVAKRPAARFIYQKLPLALDLPPVLQRVDSPWEETPLEGKALTFFAANKSSLKTALQKRLEKAGASFEAAEKVDGLVIDATEAADCDDLGTIFSFLKDHLPKLKASGRVVFLGARLDDKSDSLACATQQALVGLGKSVAKEIGKRGATAQILFFPPGERDADLATGPLIFFLSPRSAFVSGQEITLKAKGAPKDGVSFPEVLPLKGKRAIVTGAARGIGAAIAECLTAEGATVLGIDHPSQTAALEAHMAKLGGIALSVDLGDEDAVSAITFQVESLWGGVDILINNAGVTRDRTLTKMAPEAWQLVLKINLDVPARLTAALTTARGQKKALMARDGRVVFLSSVVGLAGNFGQTNYSAAKAGLLGLTRSEANRLSSRGITVNALAPGFIETAMTGHIPLVPRTFGRRLCSLKQGGLPEDVAQCAAFLVSPGAYAITGNTLRVCGQSLIG